MSRGSGPLQPPDNPNAATATASMIFTTFSFVRGPSVALCHPSAGICWASSAARWGAIPALSSKNPRQLNYPLALQVTAIGFPLRYELADGSGSPEIQRCGMGVRRVYRSEADWRLYIGGSGSFHFGPGVALFRHERITRRKPVKRPTYGRGKIEHGQRWRNDLSSKPSTEPGQFRRHVQG